MKIYTKTGDQGTTSLIGGTRLAKDNLQIETYGTLDELNAHLGLLLSYLPNHVQSALIERIQQLLFVVGSHLATPFHRTDLAQRYLLATEDVEMIEQAIDHITAVLPKQPIFSLPGGTVEAAQAHVCRTVCRRLERRMVTLVAQQSIQNEMMIFINRLSDYFYILARLLNFEKGVIEKKV